MRKIVLITLVMVLIAGVFVACRAPAPAPSPAPKPAPAPAPVPVPAPKPTPAPAPESIKLRLASAWPPPPNLTTLPISWWQEEVEKKTGGRVKFESHWAGVLFNPPACLDAIQKRMADVVHMFYGHVAGTAPLGAYQLAIPFRPVNPEVNVKVSRALWDEIPELAQEMAKYRGKNLMHQPDANYDLIARMPLRTLDDFAGKKIAVVGLWFPEQVQASGAVAVSIPAVERYTALERGVLDGEILVINLIEDFKHYEVAKHVTFVDYGSFVGITLVINEDAWKALPADIQQIMLDVAREVELRIAKELNAKRDGILKKWKDLGISFYTLSEGDRIKWAQKMPDTAAVWAKDMEAKGLPGWKIMDRYIQLAEQQGHKFPRKFGAR